MTPTDSHQDKTAPGTHPTPGPQAMKKLLGQNIGSVCADLLDRSMIAFALDDVVCGERGPCVNFIISSRMDCRFSSGNFSIDISTYSRPMLSLNLYCRQHDFWRSPPDFTARSGPQGMLHVTQEVSVSEPHLAWIDVARIAEGFGVQRPMSEIQNIAASLTSLVAQNNWRRAELRHDFRNHYVPTSPDDPGAMRAFVLFADELTEIAVGQTMDRYSALGDQFEGLPLPDVPYGKRFEFFSYRFATSS